jgi:hypothetical protein
MGEIGTLGIEGMDTLEMGILNRKWEYWIGILDRRIYMDTPSVWEVWD